MLFLVINLQWNHNIKLAENENNCLHIKETLHFIIRCVESILTGKDKMDFFSIAFKMSENKTKIRSYNKTKKTFPFICFNYNLHGKMYIK